MPSYYSAPFTFDFAAARIDVDAGTYDVDVGDLYTAIKLAQASAEGIINDRISSGSGLVALGPGVQVGLTVELLGSWQLRFPAGNYIARVAGGNLVGGPGGDPIAYTAGVQALLIQSAASTVVTAGGSVPTAAQNAAAVRTELATELARVDVATSTRLASAGYTPPPSVPTAAQNAAAVRTELATELARVDVATSTRLASAGYTPPPSVPTAAQNAAAVRTELATELDRVDVATSTRLASAGYTAPPAAATNATAVRTELAAELLRVIELAKLHGLDVTSPLTVTQTTRTAGDVAQTISTTGNTTTVTRLA
jgi:hypothetical protein